MTWGIPCYHGYSSAHDLGLAGPMEAELLVCSQRKRGAGSCVLLGDKIAASIYPRAELETMQKLSTL